jgi:hypothetical protein
VYFILLSGATTFQVHSDPCDYSRPGEPLWGEIAARYGAGDPSNFAYHVFTDGKNIVVISQSSVAAFDSGGGNPIKLVTPSDQTIQNSSNLRLVSPPEFIAINSSHINKVTKSNPVRPGMLNLYLDVDGQLTTVDGAVR